MSTLATDNLVRQVGAKKSLSHPVLTDGTGDYSAGDMVAYDSVSGGLKALTDALAAKLVGVAQDSAFIAIYTDTATGLAKKQYRASGEILIGQIHAMKTTVAQTYTHLLGVYVGADAQTVTTVDPGSGKLVGYIILENGGSVTGASGVKVNVLNVPQLPVAAVA